jgi:circadian clock protein KaiC
MLDGKGFFKGSCILVSGTAGTGKTSIASCFADSTCKKDERCLYFAFEESPEQIIRNMHSIGINLERHIKKGLLKFYASRPTMYGLEMHLVMMYKLIKQFKPQTVVLDPITNLISVGSVSEVKSILIRLIDFLQTEQITVMFTALTLNNIINEQTDEGVSSLVDAWLLVRDIEANGERNRGMYIMKSRGMKHSNQVREFIITSKGLNLIDVFVGPDGVLTGSAREYHQLQAHTDDILVKNAMSRKEKEILRKSNELSSRIASLTSKFEGAKEQMENEFMEQQLRREVMENNRRQIVQKRADGHAGTVNEKKKK